MIIPGMLNIILEEMALIVVEKIVKDNGFKNPVAWSDGDNIYISLHDKNYILPIGVIIDENKVIDFMNDIASSDTYVTDIICHAKIKEKDENKRP